jgi:hypothetical protein
MTTNGRPEVPDLLANLRRSIDTILASEHDQRDCPEPPAQTPTRESNHD